ncbi:mandelate racemase/muconate lactonizing enzyme family protein [Paenibacillus elgii]|uniref:mandelate racemase/muconate lactonizing enzyme family protein n=1 Tax=Paenibacillus elgii TaxID=189691 RepID=UPI000248CF32|nr:enolase C-terminal domain-like protein [Paenibacillus elgii]
MSNAIKQIITHIVEVPLTHTWEISLYSATTRQHAIVEVILESGIRGYGESSPSPAFMGETAETVKLVNDRYLVPPLIGLPVDEIACAHAKMNQAIYGNSAAKSAIDIALHDAWGQTLNQPLYKLIGGTARESVPLTYVVGIKSNRDAYEEAMKRIYEGFGVVKIKVGRDPKRDIELVSLIRKAIADSGKPAKLRLDANQGYDVPTAIRVIREIEETGEVECVEQPVRKWNMLGVKEIRDKVKTPIMIDEAVFGPEDAMTAIKLGIADVINLKVCKVGGIYQSKKIAAMAEAAGMTCTVGSNLELGIGIAASAHFVTGTPVVTYPSDFICGAYLHEHDLLKTPIQQFVAEGHIRVTAKPGLGIDVRTDLLNQQ